MAKRILKLVSRNLLGKPVSHPHPHIFTVEDIVWVMGSFCALNRKPFGAELLVTQLPPPYNSDSSLREPRWQSCRSWGKTYGYMCAIP